MGPIGLDVTNKKEKNLAPVRIRTRNLARSLVRRVQYVLRYSLCEDTLRALPCNGTFLCNLHRYAPPPPHAPPEG